MRDPAERAPTFPPSMSISDLERRLATERTLDIFTMRPRVSMTGAGGNSLTHSDNSCSKFASKFHPRTYHFRVNYGSPATSTSASRRSRRVWRLSRSSDISSF